jgi:hypothetical protein
VPSTIAPMRSDFDFAREMKRCISATVMIAQMHRRFRKSMLAESHGSTSRECVEMNLGSCSSC